MRLSSPAVAALSALVLLAGCMGSGGDGDGQPTGDGQPAHMPRQSIFEGDFRLLDAESDKSWFEAYGMTENPGAGRPESFSSRDGTLPESAYVGLYAYDGDRNRIFTAATMRYASEGDVEKYLADHGECRNPTPGRTILVDGLDVTILVAGLTLDGGDAELMAALEEAEEDVQDRTGAEIEC